jgi:hypothetical protein
MSIIAIIEESAINKSIVCPSCARTLKEHAVPTYITSPTREPLTAYLSYYTSLSGWRCYECDQSFYLKSTKVVIDALSKKLVELEDQIRQMESNLVRGS